MTDSQHRGRYQLFTRICGIIALLFMLVAIAGHYHDVAITNNCLKSSQGMVDCSFVTDDADSRWIPVSLGFGISAVVTGSIAATMLMINRKQPKSYGKMIALLVIAVPVFILAAQLLDKLMYRLPDHWWNTTENTINTGGLWVAIFALPALSIAAATALVTCIAVWRIESK